MGLDLKRSATIIEVLMSLFTVLGVIITAYVSISVTQARQDERIKQIESNYRDIGYDLKEIKSEMRELNNGKNEILLQLKDKQDRILK